MGNRFDDVQILKAIELGDKYSLAKIPVNSFTIHSIAIDIGFGSSNTAKLYYFCCHRMYQYSDGWQL